VRDALEEAAREYGRVPKEVPLAALTALVEAFTLGTMLERHVGVTEGHRELLEAIERWLEFLKGGKDAVSAKEVGHQGSRC
jgi:hypothetical protein